MARPHIGSYDRCGDEFCYDVFFSLKILFFSFPLLSPYKVSHCLPLS